MTIETLALGDWIEADFSHPGKHTRGACMSTPKALAYGRKLLRDPASGWRKSPREWVAQAAPAAAQN